MDRQPLPRPPGVVATGLGRRFGDVVALEHADLDVQAGKVTALVGPNGSGKTTLLLILAGLLAPDTGNVSVAGVDPSAGNARGLLGWMPDLLGHWEGLTAREILTTFARAYRVPREIISARVPELLKRFHLDDLADRPARTLSRGQQQRLGLARVLVHDPPVLLLDEPASGLDPLSRIELRDLLRTQADRGKTVLVSSHVLAELEEIAHEAVFVSRGRTLSTEHVAEVAGRARRYHIETLDLWALTGALNRLGVVPVSSSATQATVEIAAPEAAARLLGELVRAGVPVVAFAPSGGTLEGMYLHISRDQMERG